ncbi:MAG: hypothetical protein GY850_08730 [bacterium]|nr:hypothetical protein [bacterium]
MVWTACIIYRMLTGILPEEGYLPVSRFNADLDDAWDDFIKKAIAPRPAKRYLSAAEMPADLKLLQTAWEAKKEQICHLPELKKTGNAGPATNRLTPRSTSIKINPLKAKKDLELRSALLHRCLVCQHRYGICGLAGFYRVLLCACRAA